MEISGINSFYNSIMNYKANNHIDIKSQIQSIDEEIINNKTNLLDDNRDTDVNFSSFRLNNLKDRGLEIALSKRGLSEVKINEMTLAEKLSLKGRIISDVQGWVKNVIRSDIMETRGESILRGERLSNEVVSTLLFSI